MSDEFKVAARVPAKRSANRNTVAAVAGKPKAGSTGAGKPLRGVLELVRQVADQAVSPPNTSLKSEEKGISQTFKNETGFFSLRSFGFSARGAEQSSLPFIPPQLARYFNGKNPETTSEYVKRKCSEAQQDGNKNNQRVCASISRIKQEFKDNELQWRDGLLKFKRENPDLSNAYFPNLRADYFQSLKKNKKIQPVQERLFERARARMLDEQDKTTSTKLKRWGYVLGLGSGAAGAASFIFGMSSLPATLAGVGAAAIANITELYGDSRAMDRYASEKGIQEEAEYNINHYNYFMDTQVKDAFE